MFFLSAYNLHYLTNIQILTGFCPAEAGHHLGGSFEESECRVSPVGHRHHAHPLQRRGEGKPPNNGHRLLRGLAARGKDISCG